MALDDEAERLGTAEEYLLRYSANSQEFEAAMEHLRWVHKNKPAYGPRCEQIVRNVVRQARERREFAKLEKMEQAAA